MWGQPLERFRAVARDAGGRTPEIARRLERVRDVPSPLGLVELAVTMLEDWPKPDEVGKRAGLEHHAALYSANGLDVPEALLAELANCE